MRIPIELERCTPEEQQEKMLIAYGKLMAEKAEIESKPVKTILEEVANDFCEHYCKYPDKFNEEEEGCELCESEICANCPITKLV